MNVTVYGICGSDGEIRYVGQTTGSLEQRWRAHKHNALKRHTTPLAKWMRREFAAGREPRMFKIDDDATLNESEIEWISWYRSRGARLLNVTDGGEGTLGYRHSGRKRPDLAARNRAGAGKKKGPLSEAHRLAVSSAKKGRSSPWTAERNRAQAGKPGRPQTEEERAKRSAAIKAWWAENGPRETSESTRRKMSASQKRAWIERKARHAAQ